MHFVLFLDRNFHISREWNLFSGEWLAFVFGIRLHSSSITVHTQKKLAQERQLAHAPLSAQAIGLNYLEVHVRSKNCVSVIQTFLLLKHSKCLFRIKQDGAELSKQKVTVTSVPVATMKFLFGMCDCKVDKWCCHRRFFARAEDFARTIARAFGYWLTRMLSYFK